MDRIGQALPGWAAVRFTVEHIAAEEPTVLVRLLLFNGTQRAWIEGTGANFEKAVDMAIRNDLPRMAKRFGVAIVKTPLKGSD